MPSSRLAARLGQLPHDALADLAARLCSESPALLAAAEECMVAHTPLSDELVERVLLSPDLVPSILGPLKAEDGAAAAVCSQWLAGWNATNEPRRRLKQVPLELPEEIDARAANGNGLFMSATPDGRLIVLVRFNSPEPTDVDYRVRILDSSMRVLQTVACEHDGLIAASDDSIFHVFYEYMHRSSQDGTVQAEYELENYGFRTPVLAPGGLLFCVLWDAVNQDHERDEIIALDAQTLQLRHRFGLGLLNGADQPVVVGDELYVCDSFNHRLQVFSLTGEHRSSITGEWRRPERLCFAKDRLYLIEAKEDGDEAYERQGRRILVMSLHGDVLQVVTNPTEPTATFDTICCFDGKLLASFGVRVNTSTGTNTQNVGMLALAPL